MRALLRRILAVLLWPADYLRRDRLEFEQGQVSVSWLRARALSDWGSR